MARKKDNKQKETLMNLIEYNPDIMEDDKKKPNILLDNYMGICVDKNGNWELLKVKQIIVSDTNIRTTTNSYGDKYTTGDVFQEWVSMDKYPNSFESSVELYSKIDFMEKVSALEYCTDITELVKIKRDFNKRISEFLSTTTLPRVVGEVNTALSTFEKLQTDIDDLMKLKNKAIEDCENIINVISEKYASMVAKGIVVQKQVKHRTVEE